MAGSQPAVTTLSLLLVVLLTASRCAGREFVVGDGGGWVERLGHESFNDWAKRQRFHVNDTLVFKYNAKGDDGVLWVTRGQYDACNTTGPLVSLGGGGGDSRFVLKEPVEYYFIDADSNRCRIGERLIVHVQHSHDNDNTSSSPQPPKSSSSSSPPPPATTPKPAPSSAAAPPAPTSSSSAPSAPPPSPVPSSAGNVSSPSPPPVAGTNGTDPPPSKSSAVALRAGVLACLILGGAAILWSDV
ncbi:hypothetical protein QOZ80_1BG0051320 [Eleusine coracana subsp. coracana]|nr:hypothetical protein QOZ80_1BG0051320 [Eleusine coracana subsp. coracana]